MTTSIASKFRLIFQIAVPLLFTAGLFNIGITHEALQAAVSEWPQACFFHRFTGLLCPGCGMTRSLICFFSYNWSLSFTYHPLGPVLGLGVVGLWISSFWQGRLEFAMSRLMTLLKRHAMSALIVLFVWGVIRNMPEYF